MTKRRAEFLAWGLWGITLATMLAVALAPLYQHTGNGFSPDQQLTVLPFVLFATVGAIVASRRPENRLGWLYLAIGILAAFTAVAGAIENVQFPAHGPGRDALTVLYALSNAAWYPTIGLLATFSILWFPDGRPPTPRWRWLQPTIVAAMLCMTLGFGLVPGPLDGPGTPVNPFGIRGATSALGLVQAIGGFVFVCTVALSIASFVVRFRRSRGVERQQLRWFVAGAGCLGVGILIGVVFNPKTDWPFALTTSAVPVAAGIAITRYRLYDLDRLISRTVAYSAVTVLLVAVYAAIVVGVGALTGRNDNPAVIAGATLAVAALVRPLLRVVKARVDRRFARRRFDAQRALEAFAARLRDEVALEQVSAHLLETVVETLQPDRAAMWLREGARAR